MGVRQVHQSNRPKWEKCQFESRDSIVIEEDDGTERVAPYHNCSLDDIDTPCPYPARHCHFKEECEEFMELIIKACGRE